MNRTGMIKAVGLKSLYGRRCAVRVFGNTGDMIQEYEDKFDIEYIENGNGISFIGEDGKKHIVLTTTGTIIIDEK